MNTQSADPIIQEAAALAEEWQKRANRPIRPKEKKHQRQMMRLIRNPLDKVILTKMIDQSFRSGNNARVADQVSYVLKKYGVPGFFSLPEQGLMRLFLTAGRHAPGISIPKMIGKIREDSARSVIPGEKEVYPHLQKRKGEGVRMNLNHLGEAVLGEGKAMNHSYVRKDGTGVPKFVNLDMEEYRDLEITLELFRRTLDQPEFRNYMAGIVLQAYLPDSFEKQKDLTRWARKRVADGGAPVKGANMEGQYHALSARGHGVGAGP